MFQRIELENSMLLPTVHDPRYDEPYFEDAEEFGEARFEIGDIVSDGEEDYRIIDRSYDEWPSDWLYECEPIGESEYAYCEIYESTLERSMNNVD